MVSAYNEGRDSRRVSTAGCGTVLGECGHGVSGECGHVFDCEREVTCSVARVVTCSVAVAACNGYGDCLELLIERGSDLEARTDQVQNPAISLRLPHPMPGTEMVPKWPGTEVARY